MRKNDVSQIGSLGAEIIDKYGSTAYGPMAALLLAKTNYDNGDAAAAATRLQWAIDKAKDDETAALARLRLAGIRLDEKKYDEALALLDAKHAQAFAPLYADLRGDVLAAQGKADGGARGLQAGVGKEPAQQQLSQRGADQARRAGTGQVRVEPLLLRLAVATLCALLLGGCGSKGPKPAPLPEFKPSAKLRVEWRANVGNAGRYLFVPALYQDSVYAAGSQGDVVRLNSATGKTVWRIDTKAPLSGGVGVGENMVHGRHGQGCRAGIRPGRQTSVEIHGVQRGPECAAGRRRIGGRAQRRQPHLRPGCEGRHAALGIPDHHAAADAARQPRCDYRRGFCHSRHAGGQTGGAESRQRRDSLGNGGRRSQR